jgi:uncharacterized protein YpbB
MQHYNCILERRIRKYPSSHNNVEQGAPTIMVLARSGISEPSRVFRSLSDELKLEVQDVYHALKHKLGYLLDSMNARDAMF